MPLYRITAPNGQTYQIEGPDGASDADVAQAVMAQYPEAARPKPETTVGGNIKEAFKGLVPGAIGLAETAATGASALLPEDMEKAAREKIASVAGAAKAPFAAAPGYEESVGRKLGEAVGSTAPFFALGPLGMAGRVAAGGIGVAAGAGEARTAAEEKGATGAERRTATLLGAPVGLLDMLAPEIGPLKNVITTALARGGMEGATEAAQKVAQNLIAKGVYDPSQPVLAGSGEEGAYGAGAGALTSLLLDLALPGRQRGVSAAPNRGAQAAPTQPGPQVPPQAPAGTQGELFAPAPIGEQPAPAEAAPRNVEDLYLERERLKQEEQSADTKRRLAELTKQIRGVEAETIETQRAQAQAAEKAATAEEKLRGKFPALANAPELMAQSDEVKARTQGELFPAEELGGEFAGPQIPAKIEPAELTAPTPVPPYERKGPYQYKLPLRAQPTPPTFSMKDVEDTGIAPSTTRGWFEQNVVGKTQPEVQQLVDKDPALLEGKSKRAKILRELLAPQAAPFTEEKPSVPTTAETPAVEQGVKPGAGEPSVGVPVQPAAPVVPEPRARVARPAGQPQAPVGRGLVPAGQPAGARTQVEGKQPAAVTPAAPAPQGGMFDQLVQKTPTAPAAQEAAPTKPAAPAAESPFAAYAQYKAGQGRPSQLTAEITRDRQEAAKAEAFAKKPRVVGAETTQNLETGLYEAASKGDARGALQAILSAPAGLYNDLDKAVVKRLLLSSKLPSVQVVPAGSLGVQDGQEVGGMYDPRTDSVYLVDGYVGGHTLLHEMVHGYVHTAIALHQDGTRTNPGVRTLQEVYDHVAKANPQLMSEYGMTNLSEFASEAMSNKNFQAALQKIPYRRQNTFTEFARSVLRVLGLSPTEAHTALAAAMISTDNIMTAGRALQTEMTGAQTSAKAAFALAPSTESLVDSMGPLDPQNKHGLVQSIKGFISGSTPVDPPYAVKFRTQAADAAATVEHRLRDQFDGAVRDSLGKLNPMGLYRQAQDHAKLLLEYFQVGGLAKDNATGLWVVEGKEGVRPPAQVYELIDAWGAKNGYDRQRATQLASRILEGVRLDAMRTANQTQGAGFLLHLKDAEIDQLVAEYKADPELQAMSKLMDEARIAMVDNMVAVGRLTKEQGAEWKQVSGYVPFDRIEDFANNYSKVKKLSNKGIAQVGKLPELIGSETRMVGNVFDNYLNTLGWMVGQTMKTDGTVQTLRSLEDLGYAKFLGRSAQSKPNTVGMYVGGEMMYWELPSKYDVLAFKDLNPPKAGWLRNLGKFSNVLRKSVTALPPFALKQVTDDVQRAIMTSGVKNPGALLRMSLSNFGGLALAELRGIQHPSVKQFGRLGLTGEYDFEAGKPATSLLKDLGYRQRGKFETLMHRLDGITRASDLAVRKAIYDQTLKETNDALLAQTRAREFINFRRRGASDFVGAMVTTIPFFNAYIQGMDVLYRAASGKDSSSSVGRAQARRMFWSRAATVMMLSSLYALGKGDDDEDYNEMDLRTRDNNWILPGGFKIPVPGELGALFKVIPERVVEYMRRQGTPEEQTAWEATRTALSHIFEQYVGRVTPVPQAVKPLLEAWTNYSFFTGRELEGIYQKQQDPSMRRAANTSELAIAIAEFARDVVGVDKVSPILVDNALNGYFGSSASLLVAATDSLLNPTRVDRPLHKWALVSNYMYDPVGTRRMTEFYEAREQVGRANATLNELMKTDLDRAAKYAEEHAPELALEGAVNSTLEQLERTRAYRKFLNSAEGAKDMPKEAREAELREIRRMEVELTSWLREAKAALR